MLLWERIQRQYIRLGAVEARSKSMNINPIINRMSSNSTKKRRVAADGTDGTESTHDVYKELMAMKSTMNELLDHTRAQTENMKSMMTLMSSIQEEMKSMRRDMNSMRQDIDMGFNEAYDATQGLHDKLNYHEALLEDQKWKYSAPRPSEEYWDNLEHDPEDNLFQESMAEDFLSDIQKCTEHMRYGTNNGDICIIGGPRHHEEFLPHWKELTDALYRYQYYLQCSVEYEKHSLFELSGVQLSDEVIDLLSSALEVSHFNEFTLKSNRFGQKGITFSLNYLENNESLSHFYLEDNPIMCIENVRRLCQIIKLHPSIECLELPNIVNEEVNGYEMLQLIMTAGKNKLDKLDLSANRISTGGDTFVSDFFVNNSVLKHLSLSENGLDDNDAKAFAAALKHNTTLRTLDLSHSRITGAPLNRFNRISEDGWAALGKAIFDDTSLNSAADSNHSCCIYQERDGLDRFEINGKAYGEDLPDPKNVRQKKIYTMLSSRNKECSNVDHFDNDLPVELLPDMLTSIQRYSNYHEAEDGPPKSQDDVIPLSIMYEVLQKWDSSLAVFESLSS